MQEGQSRKPRGTLASALGGLEHELICDELKKTGGNMAQAARTLGITERIMGLRIRQYKIDIDRFREKSA